MCEVTEVSSSSILVVTGPARQSYLARTPQNPPEVILNETPNEDAGSAPAGVARCPSWPDHPQTGSNTCCQLATADRRDHSTPRERTAHRHHERRSRVV